MRTPPKSWKLVADVNTIKISALKCALEKKKCALVMTFLHMGRFDLKIQAKVNGGTTQESWDTCLLRLKSAPGLCCQAKPANSPDRC